MLDIILLSGPIGVGKSSFAEALARRVPIVRASTRQWLIEHTGCENERRSLQDAGDAQDKETNGQWVADLIDRQAAAVRAGDIILLDSVRIAPQVVEVRKRFGNRVFHVHLRASLEELERRYLRRDPELKEFGTYAEAAAHGTEQQVGSLEAIADLVLETDHADPNTLADTALAFAGITAALAPASPASTALVDVLVGGQYGSEGKGNICAYVARRYGALVRIGGPNAGHRVFEPAYKYVQLPSGTGSNPDAKILIAAGSTIWLPTILKEIADHGLTPDRLTIDAQAMIIDQDDRVLEEGALGGIGSTKQGVGVASARKILNRSTPLYGEPVRLARDVADLNRFVGDTKAVLDGLYRAGTQVLLEGTQGTALSIHHGYYPHVTSRETSVAGCLADAGVAPIRVRSVLMVVRTYPIRVGGTSGWMGRELDWETVASRSGIAVEELRESEKGTVSGNLRRIAEFDWAQLRRAAEINGATEIALTFADYLGIDNREASCFAELNEKTQDFIRKVERVSGVPVTMVSKAFAEDCVLDRGNWS